MDKMSLFVALTGIAVLLQAGVLLAMYIAMRKSAQHLEALAGDRVEQTSEIVHRTVVSPVRQLSGLVQGITVGLEFLFASRNRRNGGVREERRPVPQDEMFI